MKVKRISDIPPSSPFKGQGDARNINMRVLISEEDGAPNFNMRYLELEPDGQTHFHDHKWEHEIFVVEGKGAVVVNEGEQSFEKGDAVFVEQWEKHRIKNVGDKTLKLICCIPQKK